MLPHTTGCYDSGCQQCDPTTKQTQLTIALILISLFAAIEGVVGLTSNSLVLVAESGHMISDGLALGLALLATWVARRTTGTPGLAGRSPLTRSQPTRSIPRRWETWAALVNSIGLCGVALWIAWEAIVRLQAPPTPIADLPMLVTASGGLVVNSINIALLHQGSDRDLNLRAAFLHVLADALSSLGVIGAAIVVSVWHWLWADSAISLLVAGLILVSAVPLLIQSVQILRRPPLPLAAALLHPQLQDLIPAPNSDS